MKNYCRYYRFSIITRIETNRIVQLRWEASRYYRFSIITRIETSIRAAIGAIAANAIIAFPL